MVTHFKLRFTKLQRNARLAKTQKTINSSSCRRRKRRKDHQQQQKKKIKRKRREKDQKKRSSPSTEVKKLEDKAED